jgi:hypothetical protein
VRPKSPAAVKIVGNNTYDPNHDSR